MKTEGCERYLHDPEGNAGHLDTCEECRALFGPGSSPAGRRVSVDDLPVAPWEGAAHRAWPLVAGAAAAVAVLASVLFLAAGVSPVRGFSSALSNALPSLEALRSLVFRLGGALQHVPTGWQVGIAIAFVVVNLLLLLLLRRSPKGLDV